MAGVGGGVVKGAGLSMAGEVRGVAGAGAGQSVSGSRLSSECRIVASVSVIAFYRSCLQT